MRREGAGRPVAGTRRVGGSHMSAEWRSCDRGGAGHDRGHRDSIGSEQTPAPTTWSLSCTAKSSPRALAAASLLLAIPASAASFTPGAPGIGDPYYPDYGNGGYDVSHYDLRLQYQPATDRLHRHHHDLATATQDLSRFDLDFLLDVQAVRVNGCKAGVRHAGRARAGGHPGPCAAPRARRSTDRGDTTPACRRRSQRTATPAGRAPPTARSPSNEPESAWWWFPSNDHPLDKATYDISVSVPDGVQAISNGVLPGARVRRGRLDPLQLAVADQAAGDLPDLPRGRQVRHHHRHRTASGMPVINAYSTDAGRRRRRRPRRPASSAPPRSSTGERLFGPYPFEALGGVVPERHIELRAGDPDPAGLQPAASRGAAPTRT